MKIFFIIFIVLATVALVAGHYGVYSAWIWFFGIKSLALKKALFIILLAMPVGFILSSVLVHFWENFLTTNLYIIFSVWLGVVWYLALASLAAAVIFWLAKLLGITVNMPVIASILLAAAALYSVYGFWNAQQIKVRAETVSVNNLPAEWQGKKAVHISDVHLGAVHRYGFMNKVMDKIKSADPDIIFITGDLFDGIGATLNHLASPLNDLNPEHGIYFITGNHETYISLDKSLAALKETKVKVLRNESVEVNGLQVLGLDYTMPLDTTVINEKLAGLDADKPSVVLYHEPKPEVYEKFRLAKVDLALFGHTHVGQLWPFGGITKLMYKNRDFGFFQDGDFSMNVSSGVGTWGPPMRTGNAPEIVVMELISR